MKLPPIAIARVVKLPRIPHPRKPATAKRLAELRQQAEAGKPLR